MDDHSDFLDSPVANQGAHDAFLDAPPDEGAAMAMGRGALRNFPLAQQAVAAIEPGPYSENIKNLTQKAEASKAAHGTAYGAGAIAGTAAPLLIPGLGEGLEAAPILGNAAMNAVQGASDVDMTNPTGKDATDALTSAAIGGTLGMAGKYFAPANKMAQGAESMAAEAAPKAVPEAVESIAPQVAPQAAPVARQPLQQIGGLNIPTKKIAPDFSPSAERIAASNLWQGIGGTPRQLMKVFGKNDPVKTSSEIVSWMQKAGPKGKSLSGYLDRPGELLENVTKVHESSGKIIGGIIDEMGKSPIALDRQGLWQELSDASNRTADPDTAARIDRIRNTMVALGKKNEVTDFDMLQQLKGMAGEQIRKDPELSPVYGMLADRMTKAVDSYGQAIKDPAKLEAYAKAKIDYHNSDRLLPMLRYAEAKDITGGPGGHHTLRSLLSTLANTATAVTGLPPVEQMAKNVSMKAAPIARDVVNKAANTRAAVAPFVPSVGKKGLSQAAQLELANYLQSKLGQGK